jgi:hypothetical protein
MSIVAKQFSGKRCEIGNKRIELAVLLGITEIGQSDRDASSRVPLPLPIALQAPWMRTPVRREKQLLLFLGEMADLEDTLDVLNRDGSGITGI